MSETKISEAMLKDLIALAKEEIPADQSGDEEFIPEDWSGGNYDDCFDMGEHTGRILLARCILDALEIDYGKKGIA
jgi:hypothetical protein